MIKPSTKTFPEIEEMLSQAGWSLAFLPVGCYEQHGPELPLDTDIIQAEELAKRMAVRLEQSEFGRALVLPPITFTPTDPNRGYAGTVSVSGDAFRAYFESVLRGILDSDFYGIVVVNSHGSIDGLLKEVGFKIVFEQFRERANPIRPVLCINSYDVSAKAAQLFGQTQGRHADWTEFLMTYGILGPDYYTPERLERLREFSNSHDFSVKMPGVLGIPAHLRSVEGVQGEPFPAADRPLGEMADEYWTLLEVESFSRLQAEMSDFEKRFRDNH